MGRSTGMIMGGNRQAPWRRVLLLASLLPALPVQAFDWRDVGIDGDLTVTVDDNQSRAERTRDQVEDTSASARLAASYTPQTGHNSMVLLSLFAEGEQFQEVDKLNRLSFGGKAAWRWQPHSGFLAPLVEWNVSAQDHNIRTDQRDSTEINSQLFVTRRITDRLTLSLGGEYRLFDARSEVFDLEDVRGFFNIDYLFGKGNALYLTYSYLDGEVFSSAQRQFCNGAFATDILSLINASSAIEGDDAYNSTFCGDWVAYRLDATTQTVQGGLNVPLGKSASFDLSVLHADVRGAGNNDYQRNLIRATVLKRF